MKNDYIVYAAFDKDGNCLYVGEGKPDRYKHLTSGISHVYEANKFHFMGRQINVQILKSGLSKQDAVNLEKEAINELKPIWNYSTKREKNSKMEMIVVSSVKCLYGVDLNLQLKVGTGSAIRQLKLIRLFLDRATPDGVLQITSTELHEILGEKDGKILAEARIGSYVKLAKLFDISYEGRLYTVVLKDLFNEE